MKSLIFLDFDGVLNSYNVAANTSIPAQLWTPEKMRENGIIFNVDEKCLAYFHKLQKQTGASVVFTSSWRLGNEGYWLGLKTELNIEYGIKKIIGRTPYLKNQSRLQEIKQWLSEHPGHDNFIIIDDAYEFEELEERRVHTDHKLGLTEADVDKAIKLLSDSKL
jgi:hypothetical protein